ncbi:hypothetical protein [Tepidibacter hydrothermalis]|uniref:Alpha/beta hydrolase n=1 Tax=Tepidibacter hydrothermalis TaxID=3036126 RepID=A0ABY8ECE1_9FIRM|nr:hypothetical protein [Tepidibacter hydrothermalis]WFD10569.1 hypothetical protein P4S50_00415 [Tepidibacter hydrothermalis]
MNKKIKIALITLITLIIGSGALFAFNPDLRMGAIVTFMNLKETTKFEVDGDKVYMNGIINTKTPDQLKKVISENPKVKTIVMGEVPGSIDDESNFPMAKWVREKGLNTYLTKDSSIASGGTDFFLAGNKRTMEDGAIIGVHSWSDSLGKEAKDIPKDSPEHEMNRKYIEEMLGTDDFYWYTIYAAPADDIYNMKNEEILKYNMLTEPIIKKD